MKSIIRLPNLEYKWVSHMLKAIRKHPSTKPYFINLTASNGKPLVNILGTIPQEIVSHSLVEKDGHSSGTLSFTVAITSRILQKEVILKKDTNIVSSYGIFFDTMKKE